MNVVEEVLRIWLVGLLIAAGYAVGFIAVALRAPYLAHFISQRGFHKALRRALKNLEPNEAVYFKPFGSDLLLQFQKYERESADAGVTIGLDWIIPFSTKSKNVRETIERIARSNENRLRFMEYDKNISVAFLDIGDPGLRISNLIHDILNQVFNLEARVRFSVNDIDLISPNRTYSQLRMKAREDVIFKDASFNKQRLFQGGSGLLSSQRPPIVDLSSVV